MAAGSEALVLKVSADTSDVAAGLAPMTQALDKMAKEADAAERELRALSDAHIDVSGIRQMEHALDNLEDEVDATRDAMKDLSKTDIKLKLKDEAIQRARDRIDDLREQLAKEVTLGVDTRKTEAELRQLQSAIKKLTDTPAVVDVDVNIDPAELRGMESLREDSVQLGDAFGQLDGSISGFANVAREMVPALGDLHETLGNLAEESAKAGRSTGKLMSAGQAVTSFIAGPWGLAVGGAVGLIAALASNMGDADQAARELAKSIDFQTGKMERANRQLVAEKLNEFDALKAAERLGVSTQELVDTLLDGGDAAKLMEQRIEAMLDAAPAGSQTGKDARELLENYRSINGELAVGRAIAEREARAIGSVGDAAKTTAGALGDAASATSDADKEAHAYASTMDDLNRAYEQAIGSIKIFNGVTGDTHAKQVAVAEDFARLKDVVKEAGRAVNATRTAFDLTTAKGRDAETQIDDTAQAIADLTHAQIDNAIKHGQSTDKIVANYSKQREQLITTAKQLGLSDAAARAYVDSLLDTPKELNTNIKVSGAAKAEEQIDDVARAREVELMLKASLDATAKKILYDPRLNGTLQSVPTPPPPTPTPFGGLTLLQPRLYLDGRPIRAALRNDVASTVAAQLAATRHRGRL